MAITLPPPYPRAPIGNVERDEITGKVIAKLTLPWQFYYRDQRQFLAQVPVNATPTSSNAVDQTATVGTTTVTTTTQAGLYGFEYYLTIITAAGVSSSAQVVAAWTDGGQSKSKTFTAVTGNTTTTTGSERYLFQCDGGSPITYSVTYASNPANAMHFTLYVVVSNVSAVA